MNIKELREKKNLTQDELSSQTGIPRARISKWEAGKAKPKADDLRILEKFFAIKREATTDTDETDLKVAIRELSESAKLHTIIHDRDSRSIERLISLLEMKMGVHTVELPELGGEKVVDIRERSKKNQPGKAGNS